MLPLCLSAHCRRRRHHPLQLLLHHKLLSTVTTTSSEPLRLPLSHPAYMIWGSNTSLGKTLVSTGLASSFLLSPPPRSSASVKLKFLYLKPVQTGFPSDSDSHFVFTKVSSLASRRNPSVSLFASNRVLKSSFAASGVDFKNRGIDDLNFYEEKVVFGDKAAISELTCETLYAWRNAVSPHLAAEKESGVVKDSAVVRALEKCLRSGLEGEGDLETMNSLCVVETAGGVASPGPSGALQCDLYRPFRLPGVLVGDGRLGGISGTISAYESLKLRGYDIVAVVFEDHGLVNEVPLQSYLRNRVPVIILPPIPQDRSNDLLEWFVDSSEAFSYLKEILQSAFSKRIQRLNDMSNKAEEILWWPFTQHKLVDEGTVTVIDSRCGENFAVYKAQNNEFITQQFDACASWWTQGPDATLQTELARDMGYAAARFGHVMFPENVYEPALKCAELLLEGVGKGWASRVYFSDNGSTAIEIALKMAFRKFCCDNGIFLGYPGERYIELKVLALRGSYHGDTLGAMEAQAPSSFTGFLQQPWYTGRGLFLDPPTAFMCNSMWTLSLPDRMHPENVFDGEMTFSSRDQIFDKSRHKSDLATTYSAYISEQLLQYSGLKGSVHIGALIIEPVIHGAGGMIMIDPLFQRVLVKECRIRNIPVIFDEVFTGFWRLGAEAAADLLDCVPDIACFAKLMTGGVIPLAATLATDAIFNSFFGDSKPTMETQRGQQSCLISMFSIWWKSWPVCIIALLKSFILAIRSAITLTNFWHYLLKALLHGHSYSAHAMGCTAAVKAIKWFKDPQTNLNIVHGQKLLQELWDKELMQLISSHPSVQRVVALGTLFALELQAEGPHAGYASLYARSLLQKLHEDGVYLRPLGNVIYLMCGPCSSPEICRQLLIKLHAGLEEFHVAKERQKN